MNDVPVRRWVLAVCLAVAAAAVGPVGPAAAEDATPGSEPTPTVTSPAAEPTPAVTSPAAEPTPSAEEPPVAGWSLELLAPPVRLPAPLGVAVVITGEPVEGMRLLVRHGDRRQVVPVTGGLTTVSWRSSPGQVPISVQLLLSDGRTVAEAGAVGTVAKARPQIVLTTPTAVRSEARATVSARLVSGLEEGGHPLRLESRPATGGTWRQVGAAVTDGEGAVAFAVSQWRGDHQYRVLSSGDPLREPAISPVRSVSTLGHFPAVRPDAGKTAPRVAFPVNPAPVGAGPNVRIEAISAATLSRMRGISWRPGCPVGPADLRRITVNVFGFDGLRYRGEMIVHRRHAAATAATLSTLSTMQFPIRQMRLPDVYGLSPNGIGANDYRSMAADNTYGFNCRYVVGRESQRIWSPHAYGMAIDINPYENPYSARTGIFPAKDWWPRRTTHKAVFNSTSDPAVRAFTSRGFSWGGTWTAKDYHHFQRR